MLLSQSKIINTPPEIEEEKDNINILSQNIISQSQDSDGFINYNDITISNTISEFNLMGKVQNIYFNNIPLSKSTSKGIMLLLSSSTDISTLILLHIPELLYKRYSSLLDNCLCKNITITNCKLVKFYSLKIYNDLYTFFSNIKNNTNYLCPRIIIIEAQLGSKVNEVNIDVYHYIFF